MHAPALRTRVRTLVATGMADGEIARRLGLARATVRDIRRTAEHPLCPRCFPANRVGRTVFDAGATIVLHVYHGHLGCLFPRHGPGKKHHRRILLEPWQQSLVDGEPWALLRGLIRSDGCVFINRTGRYAYETYDFHNLSTDILDVFAATCEHVGLRPRRTSERVRINRREDVARLREHGVAKS